jgi:hypothetical protein
LLRIQRGGYKALEQSLDRPRDEILKTIELSELREFVSMISSKPTPQKTIWSWVRESNKPH